MSTNQLSVISCQLSVNSKLKTQNSKLYFLLAAGCWLLAAGFAGCAEKPRHSIGVVDINKVVRQSPDSASLQVIDRQLLFLLKQKNLFTQKLQEPSEDWKSSLKRFYSLQEFIIKQELQSRTNVYSNSMRERVSDVEAGVQKDLEKKYKELEKEFQKWFETEKDKLNTTLSDFKAQLNQDLGLEQFNTKLRLETLELSPDKKQKLREEEKKAALKLYEKVKEKQKQMEGELLAGKKKLEESKANEFLAYKQEKEKEARALLQKEKEALQLKLSSSVRDTTGMRIPWKQEFKEPLFSLQPEDRISVNTQIKKLTARKKQLYDSILRDVHDTISELAGEKELTYVFSRVVVNISAQDITRETIGKLTGE